NQYLKLLKAVYNRAIRQERLTRNPLRLGAALPREQRPESVSEPRRGRATHSGAPRQVALLGHRGAPYWYASRRTARTPVAGRGFCHGNDSHSSRQGGRWPLGHNEQRGTRGTTRGQAGAKDPQYLRLLIARGEVLPQLRSLLETCASRGGDPQI